VFSNFSDPNNKTLNITGYTNSNFDGVSNSGQSGDDRLVFNRQLTAAELSDINFGSGETATEIQLDGNFYEVGEMNSVPEPSTVFGALALVGLTGYRERRRLSVVVRFFTAKHA